MSNDNPQGPGQDQPRWDPPSQPGDPGAGAPPPGGGGGQPPDWGAPPPPGGPGNEPPVDWGSTPPPPASGGGNTKAIVYIVLGALIAICCCPAGTIFGIAAVVLAALALSKRGKGDIGGAQSFEKIALILLIVGVVAGIIWVAVMGASGVADFLENSTTTTTFNFE